jgi:hypothetical protein
VSLLCILAVSLIGAVFAGLTLTRNLTNTTVIQPGENSANQVTIFGNGITFINYEINVTLEQGTNTVQFYLPPNALTDTLALSGINVVEITTNEESRPLIEKGDVITVYTQDATYTGKFIGWDNMLLLEANNGTVMIPGDRITRIILSEVVQIRGPRILVQVTTDSPQGEYKLKISYLMRGPKWKPTYFIDLDTSHLDCWATIENVETWDNFTLVLVSGGPHVVIKGPIYFASQSSGLSMYGEMVDFTPTTTDEYHEYMYNGKLSFENGTTVRLPLFNGTVTLRQEYFWTSGDVQNRYHMTNTLTEPLASGTIEFYRGKKWMGEDSIDYTPENAETTATVNYAQDIKVKATVTKSVNDGHHQVQGTEIAIQNHKTTSIQITVQQDINGYTLDVCTPSASRVGSTLTWAIQVGAGDNATIYYEWEYNW